MPVGGAAIVVVMGVAGCGKSSVAKMLADVLQASFIDADDLHPQSNIDKMSAGTPLTDEDRTPWLNTICSESRRLADAHGTAVIACSALRRSYREILNQAGAVKFVHLAGSFELIHTRMSLREDHFMPESLLRSQFATLEDPADEANVITIDIDQTVEEIVSDAVRQLGFA